MLLHNVTYIWGLYSSWHSNEALAAHRAPMRIGRFGYTAKAARDADNCAQDCAASWRSRQATYYAGMASEVEFCRREESRAE